MASRVPHGTESRYQAGCRCETCRVGHAAKQVANNLSRRERLLQDPTLAPHGRSSTYCNWGCRCEECLTAARERSRDYRARKRDGAVTTRVKELQHGTYEKYQQDKCRCDQCRLAREQYVWEHKKLKKPTKRRRRV